MDLKKLNVQELGAQEMRETDGGIAWLPYLIGALVGAALTQDLDSLAKSFEEGRNSVRK